MVVVLVRVRLDLPGVDSLKEKRRRIKSLIQRLRNKFNVSVAEVEHNDTHRVATLGIVLVTNDSAFGHQVMSQIVRKIETEPEIILAEYHTETL